MWCPIWNIADVRCSLGFCYPCCCLWIFHYLMCDCLWLNLGWLFAYVLSKSNIFVRPFFAEFRCIQRPVSVERYSNRKGKWGVVCTHHPKSSYVSEGAQRESIFGPGSVSRFPKTFFSSGLPFHLFLFPKFHVFIVKKIIGNSVSEAHWVP